MRWKRIVIGALLLGMLGLGQPVTARIVPRGLRRVGRICRAGAAAALPRPRPQIVVRGAGASSPKVAFLLAVGAGTAVALVAAHAIDRR